jgi:gliding motility-associated-like protein
VALYESNSFGCDSTVSINVAVTGVPTPHLAGAPQACIQDTGTYAVDSVAGHTYQWIVIGGNVVGFAVGHKIDVYWSVVGSGHVQVRETSPAGCDSTIGMYVQVAPRPSIVVTGLAAICENELAAYSVNSVSGSTYTWSVDSGTAISGNTGTTFIVGWQAANGAVMVSTTDTQGCSSQDTMSVHINMKPHPVITGNNVGCISSSLNTYTTALQSGYSYSWSVGGGTITSGNGTNSVTVNWTAPGTNQVSLMVTNTSTGCDSIVSIPISVDALPMPSILADNFAGCAPLGVTFTPSLTNTSYHYSWLFGDGQTSTSYSPSHSFNNPGNYSIRLIVTNNTGCADTTTALVIAHALPTASFNLSYDNDIYYVNLTELTLSNLSAGANQYSWDFGNGDTSSLFQPDYEYGFPGTYTITLTVTNQFGCQDVTEFPIEVKYPEDLYIPNAFTPNGDDKNDYFSIKMEHVIELHVGIYNRWGEQIYSSDDPAFQWDGTMNGHKVEEGVYVYKIKAKGYHGKHFSYYGTVAIVK